MELAFRTMGFYSVHAQKKTFYLSVSFPITLSALLIKIEKLCIFTIWHSDPEQDYEMQRAINKHYVMQMTLAWEVTSHVGSEISFPPRFRIIAFPQVVSWSVGQSRPD